MSEVAPTLPAQVRSFVIERASLNEEAREFDIVFATETPVRRWDWELGEYDEILDCTPEAADLRRLNNGGPFLSEHDRDCQIGVHISGSAKMENRKGVARVKMGNSAKAREEWDDIKDGIRQNISVSYQPTELVLEKADQASGVKTYRVAKWVALENSLVSVPADNDCKVGRSKDEAQTRSQVTVRDPHNLLEKSEQMSEPVSAPVTAPAQPTIDVNEIRADAIKADRKRASDINDIVVALKRDNKDVSSKATEFINGGQSADEFRAWVLENAYNAKPVETRESDARVGLSDKEAKSFSILRALQQIRKTGKLDGLEREAVEAAATKYKRELSDGVIILPEEVAYFQRAQSRAQNVTTATAGGFLVDTSMGSMIELLRNQLVLGQAGISMLTGLVGNVSLPKHVSGSTAYWVSETGALTDSQSVFSQINLTPKRLGATVPYSTQFLAQSSFSAEGLIRDDLQKTLAIEKDRAGLHGTGADGQPLGIKNTSGINATVTYGGAATWADVVEHETGIAVDNAEVGSMAFVLSTATVGKWKTILKDSVAGAGYLIEGMSANGYPIYRTNQITGAYSFFGVWSEAVMASWAGQEIIVDPYALKKSAQVEITINELCDFIVRQPLAFNVSTDSAAQ